MGQINIKNVTTIPTQLPFLLEMWMMNTD